MKHTLEAMEPRICFSSSSLIADNVFPIGVWSQPSSSAATWKSRGVNTMVTYESQGGSVSVGAWSNAVQAAGLYQIREPLSNSAADLTTDKANKSLLAFAQPEEPELRNLQQFLPGDYSLWSQYGKPVFTDFSGGNVLGLNTSVSASAYQTQYLPYTDIAANDFYPTTGWGQPAWIDYSTSGTHQTPGMVVDKMNQLASAIGKTQPQWSVIETSNQNLGFTPAGTRGVYAQEFRGELWDSILHGASGVVYFPQQIGGFSYDATPAAVVTEMTTQATRINGNSGQIASILHALPTGVTSAGSSALKLTFTADPKASRLEGTTRTLNGVTYDFVLNMSWNGTTPSASNNTAQSYQVELPVPATNTATVGSSISVPVVGENRSVTGTVKTIGGVKVALITDPFAPYALHVYSLQTASAAPTPTPTPPTPVPTPTPAPIPKPTPIPTPTPPPTHGPFGGDGDGHHGGWGWGGWGSGHSIHDWLARQ